MRARASQLRDPQELRRRALEPAYDAWTITVIDQALENFRP